MKVNYAKSVELALLLGYEEVLDINAYRGTYYIKNEKIWIHDLEALKAKLQVNSNAELAALGYDIENYNKYRAYTNEMVDEMVSLYNTITHSDGEPTYLNEGMWLFPDGTVKKK